MVFNADIRDEKGEKDKQDINTGKVEKTERKKTEDRKLDRDLKETFPASDPIAQETPVTGTRARKPVLPD